MSACWHQSLGLVVWVLAEAVDNMLEQEGPADAGRLGQHQAADSYGDTQLILEQIGPDNGKYLPAYFALGCPTHSPHDA